MAWSKSEKRDKEAELIGKLKAQLASLNPPLLVERKSDIYRVDFGPFCVGLRVVSNKFCINYVSKGSSGKGPWDLMETTDILSSLYGLCATDLFRPSYPGGGNRNERRDTPGMDP